MSNNLFVKAPIVIYRLMNITKNIDLDKQNTFQLAIYSTQYFYTDLKCYFCLEYIQTRCFKLVIVHTKIVVKSQACTIRH